MMYRSRALACLFSAVVLFVSSTASAATFFVNNTNDLTDKNPGDGVCDGNLMALGAQCSLRTAIEEANALAGTDTIELGNNNVTLTLTGSTVAITSSLTINGNGSGSSSITGRLTVDEADSPSPISVTISNVTLVGAATYTNVSGGIIYSDGNLTLTNVKVNGGAITNLNPGISYGGAIFHREDALTISGSEFNGNSANDRATGGALSIQSGASATITNTTFSTNTAATGATGAIHVSAASLNCTNCTFSGNSSGGPGGALSCNAGSSVTIVDSVFSGNAAGDGSSVSAGIYQGGALSTSSTCAGSVVRTRFSGNTAGLTGTVLADGGALAISGTGAWTISDSLFQGNTASRNGGAAVTGAGGTFVNSTFSGNSAGYNGGAVSSSLGDFYSVTITGNSAGTFDPAQGGGIYASGNTVLHNSIVSGNTASLSASGDDLDCDSSSFTSNGYNLIGAVDTTNCSFAGSTANHLIGVNPMLGSLSNNGGPTSTHAPHITSPVIDAVPTASCNGPAGALTTDQRGLSRPRDGDVSGVAWCDLGAVELGHNGIVQFQFGTYTVNEAGGALDVIVRRDASSLGAVSVQYATVDGTATAGADYTSRSGTLSWNNGDLSDRMFSVPMTQDMIVEGDEAFTIALSAPTGGVVIGARGVAAVTLEDDDALANGELSLSAATYSVNENGTSVTVTVNRTGGSDGAVGVSYATSNGTATSTADYTAASGTLSWTDGDAAAKTFTVNITDDSVYEGDETFGVAISSPTGGATLGATTAAQVTIVENDPPAYGTLQFNPVSYSVAEDGASVTLTVTRTGGTDGAVSVDWGTMAGTATAGSDYTSGSDTLSWADGEGGSKTFNVAILDDGNLESDEQFSVVLSNAGGGAMLGASDTATVTIEDDEMPPVGQLEFVSATGMVSETAGSYTASVRRVGGSAGAVSVSYATMNGTATSASDYTATMGTLSWTDGDTANKTFNVPILDDTADDDNETFSIALSNATGGATLGATSSTVVTILDNDPVLNGEFSLSSPAITLTEDEGPLGVAVTRSNGTDGAVSVQVSTTNGTALAGSDYTATTTTLSWASGEGGVKTALIPILDNAQWEPSESFTVSLQNATGGASIQTPSTATITIDDNDPKAAGTLQFAAATISRNEDAGTVTLSVSRTGGTDDAVSVDWGTMAGTATAGADYTSASGTLSWNAGESASKNIVVDLLDDAVDEPNETFSVVLSNATNGATLGAADTAVVTIVDDDVPGTLQLTLAAVSVAESAATVVLNVSRTGGSDGAVAVDWSTADGTALAGADYTASNGTLSWSDGESASKAITVTLTDDVLDEPDETFTVSLSNATGGAVIGANGVSTVTLVDDDVPGALQFESATYTVSETGVGVQLAVARLGGTSGAASVTWATADGTATTGDYTASAGTLTWADGDGASQFIVVPVADDGLLEGNETFSVTLSNPAGAALGTPDTATVTIFDDETPQPGSIVLSAGTYSVAEAAGSVMVTVRRVGGTSGAVSVDIATMDGTASSADYVSVMDTLTWADGDSSDQTFVVDVTDDTLFEGNEAFTVTLANPAGGAALGGPSTAAVNIIDDDVAQRGSLQFTAATASVAEDAVTLTLTVERAGGSDLAVSADWATVDGTATSPDDFNAGSGTVAFADKDSGPKQISITLNDDALFEGNEAFVVELSNVQGGAVLGTNDRVMVTLLDNEMAQPGAVEFVAANLSAGEASSTAQLSVRRVGGRDGAIGVSFSTADGTASAGADYSAASGMLSWADGDDADKTIDVSILDDALIEGTETFTVGLANPTGGASLGASATATISVTDDEVAAAGTLSLAAVAATVDEGAMTLMVIVQRLAGIDGDVAVSFATSDDVALAGDDYEAAGGTLTWGDQDGTDKTFVITIFDDDLVEGDETFSVVLTNPTGGAMLGSSAMSVEITDDDVESTPDMGGSDPDMGVADMGGSADDMGTVAPDVGVAPDAGEPDDGSSGGPGLGGGQEADGCGCSSTGGRPGNLLLVLLAIAWVRRRRR